MVTESIISICLVSVSAICFALSHTLWHHFDKSIFADRDESLWKPQISASRKYTLPWWWPDALSDPWHIANTITIWFVLGAVVIYEPMFEGWYMLLDYGLLGSIWIFCFNLFYNYILLKKKQ